MIEGEGADHASSLGDIVISEEYAAKQAKALGYSFEEEILRLLIHGTLHLFGYDHENVEEHVAEKMFGRQDELWLQYKAEI